MLECGSRSKSLIQDALISLLSQLEFRLGSYEEDSQYFITTIQTVHNYRQGGLYSSSLHPSIVVFLEERWGLFGPTQQLRPPDMQVLERQSSLAGI